MAVGQQADVPTPVSAPETSSHQNAGAAVPTMPPTSSMATPARNIPRGPKDSDSLPIVGWARALHR